MGATSRERYAVVSCHVERPLDDAVWARFAALQEERPGGFAIAALVRPAGCRRQERTSAPGSRGLVMRRHAPRSGTTRTGRPPTTPARRALRRELACWTRGERCATRLEADALLRGRLVHGRRGGGGLRRARLRRLHAPSPAALRTSRPESAGRRSQQPASVELPSGRALGRDSHDALARRPRSRPGSP